MYQYIRLVVRGQIDSDEQLPTQYKNLDLVIILKRVTNTVAFYYSIGRKGRMTEEVSGIIPSVERQKGLTTNHFNIQLAFHFIANIQLLLALLYFFHYLFADNIHLSKNSPNNITELKIARDCCRIYRRLLLLWYCWDKRDVSYYPDYRYNQYE